MKKLIITSTLILLAFVNINAQEWLTDLDKAQEIAAKKDQKIILVFQGSDWCAPCMKLENEIWSSKEFKAYAKENFVLLKADFPRRRKNKLSKEQQKHNDALAEMYNNHGKFPLVVILDKNGKVLGKTGYKRKATPNDYIKLLNSFIK